MNTGPNRSASWPLFWIVCVAAGADATWANDAAVEALREQLSQVEQRSSRLRIRYTHTELREADEALVSEGVFSRDGDDYRLEISHVGGGDGHGMVTSGMDHVVLLTPSLRVRALRKQGEEGWRLTDMERYADGPDGFDPRYSARLEAMRLVCRIGFCTHCYLERKVADLLTDPRFPVRHAAPTRIVFGTTGETADEPSSNLVEILLPQAGPITAVRVYGQAPPEPDRTTHRLYETTYDGAAPVWHGSAMVRRGQQPIPWEETTEVDSFEIDPAFDADHFSPESLDMLAPTTRFDADPPTNVATYLLIAAAALIGGGLLLKGILWWRHR